MYVCMQMYIDIYLCMYICQEGARGTPGHGAPVGGPRSARAGDTIQI